MIPERRPNQPAGRAFASKKRSLIILKKREKGLLLTVDITDNSRHFTANWGGAARGGRVMDDPKMGRRQSNYHLQPLILPDFLRCMISVFIEDKIPPRNIL